MTTEELAGAAADEIRAAQVARLTADIKVSPHLGPEEFARKDAEAMFPNLSKNKLERELRELVAAGVLCQGVRHDPRTGRQVIGYWYAKEAI